MEVVYRRVVEGYANGSSSTLPVRGATCAANGETGGDPRGELGGEPDKENFCLGLVLALLKLLVSNSAKIEYNFHE